MGRNGSGVTVRGNAIRITFTHNGKTYRPTLKDLPNTPANLKYAHRLLHEINERIRHGVFVLSDYFQADGEQSALTLSKQIEHWLMAQSIEASTKAAYEAAARFWKPIDRPIRALVKSDFLTHLAKSKLSGKTLNNYTSVVREALQLAVDDGKLTKNPAADIPRQKWQKEPPDPFSREESEAIIARFQNTPVANFVEFWMWTGLRTSEIFALQWSQIALAKGEILINRAKVRGITKATKTNTARIVTLNSRARAALEAQRSLTQLEGKEVFQDPRYRTAWADERAFRRSYWEPALKVLGIRYRQPYDMRHTYATAMLMAGMTPAFCARQLGHSVEIFLRTYSKWLDGPQNSREMDKLEITLNAQQMTKPKREFELWNEINGLHK